MRLRIGTLNLAGLGLDWFGRRRQRMVDGISRLDLDVLCLQEVAARCAPASYDQALDLSERLHFPVVFFAPYGNPEEVESRSRGGLAALARWPLRYAETLRLPEGTVHPDNRVALLAAFTHPEGELRVASTHLSWRPEDAEIRAHQTERILMRLGNLRWLDPGGRCVLAGDLNADEHEPIHGPIRGRLVDAFRTRHPEAPGYTFAETNPLTKPEFRCNRRLDYVYVDPEAQVLDAGLALTPTEGGVASDHFAVVAEIRWQRA